MKPTLIILFSTICLGLSGQNQGDLSWLRQNVVPVSTTNQYMDNSREYEPLRKILNGKDIVLLGEEDHVFATTFESKTKLIRFLHKEMGFTVLAFEYDIYSLANAYKAAAEKKDPKLLQNALYSFWGRVKSTESLFPYIVSTTTGSRPLKVIGFDCQTTPVFFLVDSIDVYLNKKKSAIPKFGYYQQFVQIFKRVYSNVYQYKLTERERLLLYSVFDDILFEMELDANTTASFKILKQSLLNFKNNLDNLWVDAPASYHLYGEKPPNDSIYGFAAARQSMGPLNRRDKLMAENIRWIKEALYPGEKIIIWAASEHTMYNRHEAVFHNFLTDSSFQFNSRFTFNKAFKTMGTWLKGYYGEKIYSLGFTTLNGTVNFDRSGKTNFPAQLFTGENSLESFFSKLKSKNGILDFSSKKVPVAISNPGLFHNCIGGQPNMTGNITRFFDGIFYTGEMKPLEFIKE
jgi:erythromycin esterase